MAITIRDVAKLAGTSVSAVSATLNGRGNTNIRVSSETRARIIAAASQLGYVSNAIAKSLATGRAGVLGVTLPYADAFIDQNPFCMTIMRGIMSAAISRHQNVMLYTATEGITGSKVAMMIDSRVDGVVLVMPDQECPIVTKLQHRRVPFVCILAQPRDGLWTVNSNDYEGARLATRHLVELGHRRIVHLAGQPAVITTAPRIQGFKDAIEQAGISEEESYVVQASFDWRQGREATLALFGEGGKNKPTAIFAANDLCAQGVLSALRDLRLRVPRDVAVVGYDDTSLTLSTQPPLTSVHMGVQEMGEIAVGMLIDRIEGREVPDIQPVLPVRLVVRESCGARAARCMKSGQRVPTAIDQ